MLRAHDGGTPNIGGAAVSAYASNDVASPLYLPSWRLNSVAATSSTVASGGSTAFTQFHSERSRPPCHSRVFTARSGRGLLVAAALPPVPPANEIEPAAHSANATARSIGADVMI